MQCAWEVSTGDEWGGGAVRELRGARASETSVRKAGRKRLMRWARAPNNSVLPRRSLHGVFLTCVQLSLSLSWMCDREGQKIKVENSRLRRLLIMLFLFTVKELDIFARSYHDFYYSTCIWASAKKLMWLIGVFSFSCVPLVLSRPLSLTFSDTHFQRHQSQSSLPGAASICQFPTLAGLLSSSMSFCVQNDLGITVTGCL